MSNSTPQKIEVKSIKHTFTLEERDSIGGDLARALGTLRGIETEFDQVKASYKSKEAEANARIQKLETDRINGFEMRQERCRVVYRPSDRKKDYFLEHANGEGPVVVLTEDMTNDDFQADLLLAESKFECKAELELFAPAGSSDVGKLIVGRFGGKWYSALRIKVGGRSIEERLDSEQRAYKQRHDAIKTCGKRALQWFTDTLGKDSAKGFEQSVADAIEAESGKEE